MEKGKKDFEDRDIEEAFDKFIRFHNNFKKSPNKYTPNEIRYLDDEDLITLIPIDTRPILYPNFKFVKNILMFLNLNIRIIYK